MKMTRLFLSLSGGTKKIIETAKIVQLKEANIISMTAFNTNELTSYATHTLFCFADNHDTKKMIPSHELVFLFWLIC